jgi:NAD(P)-dependent dehydrogenase (short-subunit alcohol dehydrogenase family)
VIAGGGPRLGLAVAERYAREGFAAYMLLRHPERLASRIVALQARDLRIVSLQCDVGSSQSVDAALRRIGEASGGRYDVLVYNAFAGTPVRASCLRPETVLSELGVNVAGALAFVNGIVNTMRATGTGAMIFSGCGLAQEPSPEQASLSIGKAALRALVDCLAKDVNRHGIRVGMVTVIGMMPRHAADVAKLAELYWQLFVMSDRQFKPEMQFRTTPEGLQ